jgi:predicted Zn-dependent protease
MNNGDLAVEKGEMEKAMEEYGKAETMFPDNLEMKYWHAITLANNGDINGSIKLLKEVYKKDKNWKELTDRLPEVGLLTLSPQDLQKVLKVQ